MTNILNNYVCTVPFSYLEIHKNDCFCCCPSWVPEKFGTTDDLENVWNSDMANKIRKSVLDGTYKYCDKINCPNLSQLIHTEIASNLFIKKEFFTESEGPTRLNLSFDRSCNLSCSSCRKDIIMANSDELKENKIIIDNISNTFGKTVTSIYISGAADPFASKTFRDFLINFDSNLFPKLREIHIHTNGLLLDKNMWNQLVNVHKYIRTIEISIDAATEETYKIVRGGNWQKLLENIYFISNIRTISKKIFSFVVQDTNYKEMKLFYDLISNLPFNPKNNFNVYFGKILNWETYTNDEFLTKQIWNENHPEFDNFIKEFKEVGILYNSTNNMYNIIEKFKLIPNKKNLI